MWLAPRPDSEPDVGPSQGTIEWRRKQVVLPGPYCSRRERITAVIGGRWVCECAGANDCEQNGRRQDDERKRSRHLLDPQDALDPTPAPPPPAFHRPIHPDLQLRAEPRRALVRRADHEMDQARHPPLSPRP